MASEQWRWLLQTDPDVPTKEQLVTAVSMVAELVPCGHASSITERDGARYFTSAASSALALELDLAQYDSGDGPCLAATRDRQVHLVHDTHSVSSSDDFTAFAGTAVRLGVRSSMSVPIGTGRRPAALNIYARDADAFGDRERAVAQFLGRALSRRLAGSSSAPEMTDAQAEQVRQRQALMDLARDRLAQAAGHDLTAADAFAELTARSRSTGRSIYDVARDLVAGAEVLS